MNVTINGKRVFKPDGSTRKSDLKIVNLRRNVSSGHGGISWEEVIIKRIQSDPNLHPTNTFLS